MMLVLARPSAVPYRFLVMQELDTALGRWMASQREARGVSQEALATQLGTVQPTMSKLERGVRRITVPELLSWASALGIPIDALCKALAQLASSSSPTSSLWESLQ